VVEEVCECAAVEGQPVECDVEIIGVVVERDRRRLRQRCHANDLDEVRIAIDKEVIAQMDAPSTVHDVGWYLLYATSQDGLAWRRPSLGLHKFAGSAANNAVARDCPNVGVFKDLRDPDPTRRYKMVFDVGLGKPRACFSADGIHWSVPEEVSGFTAQQGDTHNNAFYDTRLGKYLWFTKLYLGERLVTKEKEAGAAYLTKAAAAGNAVKTDSGLVYVETAPGTGAAPTAADRVKVHYRGTLINGTEFDSSYARNEPADFPLSGVIRCWTEGVQRMKVGGKARLVCPSDLAYGDRGNDDIPGGAALIFDIELLDIISPTPRVN